MVDRVDSRTLSSSTLVAGIGQLERQEVKQEPMEEKAAMEKELQDSCNARLKIPMSHQNGWFPNQYLLE